LKSGIIMKTEEITTTEAESISTENILNKDNTDVPTRMFIGESPDGSAGEARFLKNRIEDFKKNMLALLPEENKKNIDLGLDVSDASDMDGNKVTWEVETFSKVPLIAVIVILNQKISEIEMAEYKVITHLTCSSETMKTCKEGKEKKCCKKDEKKNNPKTTEHPK